VTDFFGFLSSAFFTQVFPGGNYDEKQDESYQMTAIRETFEETGLLLASRTMPSGSKAAPSEAILDGSRVSIHAGRTLFSDFLRQHALAADVDALLPFTEWITPLGLPRCVQQPYSYKLVADASPTFSVPLPRSCHA
jgi:8-oxo-dGTP pyrophosphatase MutT (NUDIX family)